MTLITKIKNRKEKNFLAQGSLEYLLVIGVAILVVAIIVFALSGILSSTNNSIETDKQMYGGLQYIIDESKNKTKIVLILKPGKNDINFSSIEQDNSIFGVFGEIVDGTNISFDLDEEINGISEIDSTKIDGVFYQNDTGVIVNDYSVPLNEIVTIIVPQDESDQKISVIVNVNNQPIQNYDDLYFVNTGLNQSVENLEDLKSNINTPESDEEGSKVFTYLLGEVINITTCSELINEINLNPRGKIVLQNNIDCSNVTNFVPIKTFSGILDGNNYTISNLIINKNTNFRGFFIKIENAIIQRINFENIEISEVSAYSGILGSYAQNSTILNVKTSGKINSENYAGGLIGWSKNNNIINSSTQIEINGNKYVGGLIGSSINDLILNTYSRGKIIGVENTGGLVGGLVDGNIENSYSIAQVNSTKNGGGLIGNKSNGGIVVNSFWDVNVSNLSVSAGGEGKTTQQMKTQNNYTNWNFDTVWQIVESINDGYPSFK